jgi:hypothetical protein
LAPFPGPSLVIKKLIEVSCPRTVCAATTDARTIINAKADCFDAILVSLIVRPSVSCPLTAHDSSPPTLAQTSDSRLFVMVDSRNYLSPQEELYNLRDLDLKF